MVKLLLTDPVHPSVGALPKEVPMASYGHYHSTGALVPDASLSPDLDELEARAARYRHLANTLCTPSVVAEVQACARELDSEAVRIETQASFVAEVILPYRDVEASTHALVQAYLAGGGRIHKVAEAMPVTAREVLLYLETWRVVVTLNKGKNAHSAPKYRYKKKLLTWRELLELANRYRRKQRLPPFEIREMPLSSVRSTWSKSPAL
jgi:hypothetical protein